jgi:hypothetical protein
VGGVEGLACKRVVRLMVTTKTLTSLVGRSGPIRDTTLEISGAGVGEARGRLYKAGGGIGDIELSVGD